MSAKQPCAGTDSPPKSLTEVGPYSLGSLVLSTSMQPTNVRCLAADGFDVDKTKLPKENENVANVLALDWE